MKVVVVVLTRGSSAVVKMVESVEKIKAEYPDWEVSILTPEMGEIKLEAQAHGYDYAYATLSVIE